MNQINSHCIKYKTTQTILILYNTLMFILVYYKISCCNFMYLLPELHRCKLSDDVLNFLFSSNVPGTRYFHWFVHLHALSLWNKQIQITFPFTHLLVFQKSLPRGNPRRGNWSGLGYLCADPPEVLPVDWNQTNKITRTLLFLTVTQVSSGVNRFVVHDFILIGVLLFG